MATKTEFNGPGTNYNPRTALETPYQRAYQEWDDRIGSARVQAANWRLAAIASIVLSIILAVGIIYQSSKSSIIPYIVTVDSLGRANAVNRATEFNYNPTEASVKYFLSRFVMNVRGVPVDPVVLKKQWVDAYAFVTSDGNSQLTSMMTTDKPFDNVSKILRTVEVSNILALSKRTYQIRWIEDEYDSKGVSNGQQTYTGVFTIALSTPSTEDNLLKNPLGIYVDQFKIEKDQSKQ